MERRLTMIMGARRGELARVFVAVFVAVAMMLSMTAGIILPAQTAFAVEEPQDENGGGDQGNPPANEPGEDPETGGESEPAEEPQGGEGSEEPEFAPLFFFGGGGGGKQKATLIIKKYGDPDIDGQNVLIGGATFKVEYCDDYWLDCFWGDGWKLYDTVTDNDPEDDDPTPGIIKLSNLDPDRYRVQETNAPSGYKRDDDKETVELGQGQEKTVSFTNLRNIDRPAILIEKYGEGKLLGGATFEICRRQNNNWVDCFQVTDNQGPDEDVRDGIILIDGLNKNRTYRVREVAAPQGWTFDPKKSETVNFNDQKKVVRKKFYNQRKPQADIEVVKSVHDASPLVGEQTTFRIAVTNNGPNDATGVQVEDALPTGVTYEDHLVTRGTYDPATGIWDIGDLNKGETVVLTIDVTVDGPAGVEIENIATRTASSPEDPNRDNDSDSASVTPQALPEADLGIEKEVDNAAPYVGDQVTFTIKVTNHGPDDATDVVVSDLLPAGLEYVSDDSAGAYDKDTGEWDVGDLDSGESVELRITVKVTGPAGETITNVAEILTSEPGDENDENDSASASVTPRALPEADLGIEKGVDNETPYVGDQVTFTIKVMNHGPDDATDVVVSDLLPDGLEYVSDDSAGAYDKDTGEWDVGDLGDGESAELKITVKVTGPAGETITNVAEILTSEPGDGNDENDSASASVTPIARGTIVVEKRDQFQEPVPGARFELRDAQDEVVDEGETDENGILEFKGVEPGTYTVVEVEAPEGYEMGGEASASVTVNIDGTVDPEVLLFRNNKLDDDGGDDNPPPPRVSSRPRVDLSVTKTVDDPAAEEGQQVTFTVTVTNEGPDDASGVVVSDILPAGLAYVSHNASQGTYDPVSGDWVVGNLADDASATLTVVAVVSPGTGGLTLVNTARVVSSNPSDRDAGNNSDSASVTPPQLVLIEEEEPAAGPGAGEAPPLPVTGGTAAMLVIPGILSFAAGLYLRRRFF